MKQYLTQLKSAFKQVIFAILGVFDLHTVAALTGLVMIAVALWGWDYRLCLLVVGTLILTGAVFGQLKAFRKPEQ